MTVICKMRMSACTEVRNQNYVGSNAQGKSEYELAPGARVELAGVQSEPFGKYTPWAEFKANIFGEGAARWFSDMWRKFVRDPHPEPMDGPNLYVIFMTPAEYEAHFNGGSDVTRSEREASV